MNNPIVTKFLNEAVRPMTERLRGPTGWLGDVLAAYDADVAPLLEGVDDATLIDDGRASSGVPLRTVGELRRVVTVFRAFHELSRYRDAHDNTRLQTQMNAVMGGIDVQTHLRLFTVRSALFGS